MDLYSILRHGKVTSKGQAGLATAHNYRQYEVPNVDQDAPHPNVEFVNVAERGYWELAEERIAEAGIIIRRHDQIRCVEIILTASPEFFNRDENGRAEDMSDSQWMKDIRTYLIEKYGEKNIIGCQLQQDEKSPHVHAMIVPITADNRLSARDLFGPVQLRANQTEFAEAMAVHGLVRGEEGSQSKHKPMRQMYGQQATTAAEMEAQLGEAATVQAVKVANPGYMNGNPVKWAEDESKRITEDVRRQVEEANKRADKAQALALENAGAKDQVRVLKKQLRTSEELKEVNYGKFQGERSKLDDLAMRLASGEAPPKSVLEHGHQALDQFLEEIKAGREKIVQQHEHISQATKKGDYTLLAKLERIELPEMKIAQNELETRFRGFTGGAERLDKLDDEQAKEVADKDEQAKKLDAEQAKATIDRAEQAKKVKQEQDEKLEDVRRHNELMKEIRQEEAARNAAQKERTHELTLMDKAFVNYRKQVGSEELTACLIVPDEKVKNVLAALRPGDGSSWAYNFLVAGEPLRRDGQEAVYVKYSADFAHRASRYFDSVRAGGSKVYEHAPHQSRREQLRAQPEPKEQKVQGPKQEITQVKGNAIGD